MRLIAALCAVLATATPGLAEDRETLGVGRIFNNDYFGDTDDRWRTGSYTISIVRGADWEGAAPTEPGALLEYRLRSEIIAPNRLNGPDSMDRAYVGSLSAGLHTHVTRGDLDISAGMDLVFVGPQTGLAAAQDGFHELVDAPNVSDSVSNNQVQNAVYPTAIVAASYPIQIDTNVTLRPYAEAQYGVENIARIGADAIIGPSVQGDLWLRDSVTGHLYSGVRGDGAGFGYVLGADYSYIGDSAYFPASFGTVAEDERFRVRAGIHARFGSDISYFYGVTYLSEEYVGQPEGQLVGSLKLNFNF